MKDYILIYKKVIEEIEIKAGSGAFINKSELIFNSKEVEVLDIDKVRYHANIDYKLFEHIKTFLNDNKIQLIKIKE